MIDARLYPHGYSSSIYVVLSDDQSGVSHYQAVVTDLVWLLALGSIPLTIDEQFDGPRYRAPTTVCGRTIGRPYTQQDRIDALLANDPNAERYLGCQACLDGLRQAMLEAEWALRERWALLYPNHARPDPSDEPEREEAHRC